LGDQEYNVFKGFFNNTLFLIIFVFIVVVQVLLIQYGGKPIHAAALNSTQYLICLAFGAFELVMGILIKLFLPTRWFSFGIKEAPLTSEEISQSFVSNFKKSFRESSRFREVTKNPKVEAMEKGMGSLLQKHGFKPTIQH